MSITFTDTETTGKIPKYATHRDLRQLPHMVQLAAIRTDDSGTKEEGRMNVIIKPEGWEIPKEAADIHGITTERAMDEGIPIKEAMSQYHELMRGLSTLSCYNVAFDSKILSASYQRAGATSEHIFRTERKHLCVMLAATPVVNLPSNVSWSREPAWPKLHVAVETLLGRPMRDGAHDAMVDVEETLEVFKFLVKTGHIVI